LTRPVLDRVGRDVNVFPLITSNLNHPNSKAQKPFRENEMTLFFGQVSRCRCTRSFFVFPTHKS